MDDLYIQKLDLLIDILSGDIGEKLDACRRIERDIDEFQKRLTELKQEVNTMRDLKKDLEYLRGSEK